MLYAILKTVHVLSIAIWIGGMVFTQFFLRPALMVLEPPMRLRVMHALLGRFLNAMLLIAGLTVISGGGMLGRMGIQTAIPLEWLIMAGLGGIMLCVLLFIRFVLYVRLTHSVSASAWAVGAVVLGHIRKGVGINLSIAVLIVFITLLGNTA
jgi:uncharacterized membrane protein